MSYSDSTSIVSSVMSKWCIFSLSTVSLTSTGCSSGFQPFKICFEVFKFEDVSPVFSKLFILTDSSAIGCRLNCSRNVFAVFRKFCIFFQLDSKCLWAFDSKVVRYQILAAKVQAVYILELCITKDLMLNYVLQVVHFLLLFLSACISLDSGQPTISHCFYAIKKCMLLTFFQQVRSLYASYSIKSFFFYFSFK